MVHNCLLAGGKPSKCKQDKVDDCVYLNKIKQHCVSSKKYYNAGFQGIWKEHYCANKCGDNLKTQDVNTKC